MRLRVQGGGMEFPRKPVVVGVLPPLPWNGAGVEGRLAQARQMAADGADWVEWGGEDAPGEAEEAAGLRAFLERWSGGEGALPVLIRTGRESTARLALEAGGNMLCGGRGLAVEAAARVCAETGAALMLAHVFGGPAASGVASDRTAFARSAEVFFEESFSLAAGAGLALEAVALDAGDAPGGIPGGCVVRDLMERLGRPWCASVSGLRLPEPVLGGEVLGGEVLGGEVLGGNIPGGNIRGGNMRGGNMRGGQGEVPVALKQEAALVACTVQAVLAGAHFLRVEHARHVRAAVYAARTIAAVLDGGRV